MSRRAKTDIMVKTALGILADCNPMTVRQVYYQLVSRQIIPNSRTAYQSVSNALVDARREGLVPWEWIEDRNRRPRRVSTWGGLADFADTCRRAYRREVWATQPVYIETWLEKDALSGIFEDALDPYCVALNVGRGYDGWSSIQRAAARFNSKPVPVSVLYFGDFDPSGQDMIRSLIERLATFDCHPEVVKCALTRDDIAQYELPPDFAKKTDTRTARFIAANGDISVELDALPMDALRGRLIQEVEARMDLSALATVKALEETERTRLESLLIGAGKMDGAE